MSTPPPAASARIGPSPAGSTTFAPAAVKAARFGTRIVASRVRRSLIVASLCAALALIAGWTYRGVEQSLRELRAQGLPALLEAKTKSIEVFLDGLRGDAKRWAHDPRLAAKTVMLTRRAGRGIIGARGRCRGADVEAWREALATISRDEGVVAANAVDRSGRIIASTLDGVCGMQIQPRVSAPDIARVFEGGTQWIRPFANDPALVAARPFLGARPLAWVETPVTDASGRVVAALGFATYVDADFESILAAARPGETGEAYAFDENGILLSEIRSTRGLRAAGLLPPDGSERAAFRLMLRDPGAELVPRMDAVATPENLPLTRSVATALAAAARGRDGAPLQGVLLDPYRNYRGAEVIGAWRWLRDERIGIVAEIGIDEAYGPLRYVRHSLALVLALLVLTTGWAAWTTLAYARLARNIGAGRRIGAYRLAQKLAEGGMATIHLAHHALLKRPTAIKILKRHLATDELSARFEREVRLASALLHPNTIEIYDYGYTPDGLLYYAMEFIDGVTLEQLVARDGPPPLARSLAIVRQVCAALAEVHAKGMVHRDLKPDNVMITERGGGFDFVKLIDFGIGKRTPAGGAMRDSDAPDASDDDRMLTLEIRLLGSPAYMAPERVANPGLFDPRSDIYGVGAILYFLASGRPPFEAADQASVLREVLAVPAARLSAVAPRVPPELDALIARCLDKSPASRPGDVAALVAELEALPLPAWPVADARAWWSDWRATRAGTAAELS